MITVTEALNIIKAKTPTMKGVTIPITQAVNRTLSENIYAPINFPPNDQSAMDGYAVGDTIPGKFRIIGEIKAGDDASDFNLKIDEAVRIFTGAMVPKGSCSVIRQEDVNRISDSEMIFEVPLREGENIRYKGEQIVEGDLALTKNKLLKPGIIGFLAMLGIQDLQGYKYPVIKIVATGNELVGLGEPLETGKIYESNTYLLKAALEALGFGCEIAIAKDEPSELQRILNESLEQCDLLILTGGISVGDYDFVKVALENAQVHEHFYKVKQKPGKPLFFGTKESKVVFALPGNPAAVLTSFKVYVSIALQKMVGREEPFFKHKKSRLKGEFKKNGQMTLFLKGLEKDGAVEVLEGQGSAVLRSFADANCLIVFDEEERLYSENDDVNIITI